MTSRWEMLIYEKLFFELVSSQLKTKNVRYIKYAIKIKTWVQALHVEVMLVVLHTAINF